MPRLPHCDELFLRFFDRCRFALAVKKMSEYGVDDGFAEKVEACLRTVDLDELHEDGCAAEKNRA
jgi:hypothetical protein